LNIAKEYGIPTLIIQRKTFYETENILDDLREYHIGFIALAGFLWLVPAYLVAAYPNKMVNIHPALLPQYGGKGMYGHFVHEAVKAANETESGITIHYVNTRYDEGDYIFQAKVGLSPEDTPEIIAQKVLALEHRYFPEVIERLVRHSE
jgi:phosphoribosylglycinamide formyltransferase-1